MKKNKLVVGVISALVVQLAFCSISFADSSVSATQDGIKVTKKAEWTKYKEKSYDEDGNPYAKVTFTLDTTNAETEIEDVISKGGDTDVVVLLDNSVSMNYADNKDKFADAKAAANKFAADMLAIREYKVRVGLVSFATTAVLQMELGTDLNTFKSKVEPLKAGGGTNIQHAVWHAQNMLKESTAKNKVIVLLSDGHANGRITFSGIDIASGANDDECAQNQVKNAIRLIPDLKVVGIAYDTRDKDEEALAKLTTEDANGNKLFYKANTLGGNVASSIQNVFDKITEVVARYVIGNSLTDKIPEEFNIVEETITCNDSKVKAYLSDDKKTLQWNWGENKLEKKKYEMSFIMALDKAKTPEEYFKNKTEINTNGEKIDPTIDTLGSSKMCYGSRNIIQLKSPTLPLSEDMLTMKEVVEDDKIPTAPEGSMDSTPPTGDDFNIALVSMLAVSGVVVLMLGVKLRKRA